MAKKKAAKKRVKAGIVKEVQIDKNCNGCYFSRQVGHNGKILYPSEAYSSHAECYETAVQTAVQLGVPLVYVCEKPGTILRVK